MGNMVKDNTPTRTQAQRMGDHIAETAMPQPEQGEKSLLTLALSQFPKALCVLTLPHEATAATGEVQGG